MRSSLHAPQQRPDVHLVLSAFDEVSEHEHTLHLLRMLSEDLHGFLQLPRGLPVALYASLHVPIILLVPHHRTHWTRICLQVLKDAMHSLTLSANWGSAMIPKDT